MLDGLNQESVRAYREWPQLLSLNLFGKRTMKHEAHVAHLSFSELNSIESTKSIEFVENYFY